METFILMTLKKLECSKHDSHLNNTAWDNII